jgi:hypothetical protein
MAEFFTAMIATHATVTHARKRKIGLHDARKQL